MNKLSFSVQGMFLFGIIMIPNMIWFVYPSSCDVLRNAPSHPILDKWTSVFQIGMVMTLCIVPKQKKNKTKILWMGIFISALLYYACWILYYSGTVALMILWGLTIFPCLVFLFLALIQKNTISILFTLAFTACHMYSTYLSFGLPV